MTARPDVLTVEVDQDACCSSGLCADALGAVFGQRAEDGVATVVDSHPPAHLATRLQAVAFRCPSRAVRVEVPAIRDLRPPSRRKGAQ